jgi:hypothetical protein
MKQYYQGRILQLPDQDAIATQEGIAAVEEAIQFLRRLQPLSPLNLSQGMSMGARDHVNDLGPKGTIGHYGSDGSQFLDRISRYGESQGAVGENITYGVTSAQTIVMQMIVDDGIAGRYHRENIFFDGFNTAGIACGRHQRYQYMCAIAYSGNFSDRLAVNPSPTLNPTRINNPSAPQTTVEIAAPANSGQQPITVIPVPPAESVSPGVEVIEPSETLPDLPAIASPETTTAVEVIAPSDTLVEPPAAEEINEPSVIASPETTTAVNPPPASPREILKEQGILEDGDAVYERDGSLYDVHSFEGQAGRSLKISVESDDFDTFLAIFDENDQIIGQNDDIDEENTNSAVQITLPRNGTYRIFINGYDASERGSYTVTVSES